MMLVARTVLVASALAASAFAVADCDKAAKEVPGSCTWTIDNFAKVPTRDSNKSDATSLLEAAQAMMVASYDSILSTHALGGSAVAGAPFDINARVVTPKPVDNITNASSMGLVLIDTNSLSRKYQEIKSAVATGGVARASLLYYDRAGVGYVAFRGNATIADPDEARREWFDGWAPFYPQGKDTTFYAVIRFVPDWLEIVSVARENVSSGLDDWSPVSLQRPASGVWEVVVPPSAAPSPPPSPSADSWICAICQHVYDPQNDGAGMAFEELPDTWVCPVCAQPKSAYTKQISSDGSEEKPILVQI